MYWLDVDVLKLSLKELELMYCFHWNVLKLSLKNVLLNYVDVLKLSLA
ncbi:hypothetical protein [Ligilactobacillus salivarius]|nr:hypothetical protein [Ligilactobacillus salivarius]